MGLNYLYLLLVLFADCKQVNFATDSFGWWRNTNQSEIVCPANISRSMSPSTASSMALSIGNPTVSDNCAVQSVVKNAPPLFPAGITNVIWTVTDASGNQNTCTQRVEIKTTIQSLPIIKEAK